MSAREHRPHARLRLAATAATLAGLLAALWLLTGKEQPAGAAPHAVPAAAAKVVGEVTRLAGSERLRVSPARGGRPTALRAGSTLRLGDVVDPGRGVKATIKLQIPRGVPTETELIYVRPTDGRRYDVRLRRTSPRSTTVTIED